MKTNQITKFGFNSYRNIKSLPENIIDYSLHKTNQIKDYVLEKYDEVIKTEEDFN